MREEELEAVFDRQAGGYDRQWSRLEPVRNALHQLLDSLLAPLPADATVICVGVGTGAELAHLAARNDGWRFTAVDPSGAMLDVCRERAEREGFASRCVYHRGYLDTLPAGESYDVATCFLVSQFLLEPEQRIALFQEIASRLKPDGCLASSDLAWDVDSPSYESLLRSWIRMMSGGAVSPDQVERTRAAYAKDVAVLPPDHVASLIKAGGFELPATFFQAGLLHAWFARRA